MSKHDPAVTIDENNGNPILDTRALRSRVLLDPREGKWQIFFAGSFYLFDAPLDRAAAERKALQIVANIAFAS